METLDDKLNKIAELYYDEIFKFCLRRMQNEHEAYDVTQDVFLALVDSYSKINPEKVRKWLYETAKNKIADYFRIKKKRLEYEQDTHDKGGYTLDDTISEEHIEQLRQTIISELSKEELELYKDYFIKDMSYKELCEKYNVKKDVMYKRISRLKALLSRIKDKYF